MLQAMLVLAAIALHLAACAHAAAAARPVLRFSASGEFKILQLTDLHYGSVLWRDDRTTNIQTAVLQAEQEGLGLAVFSGDMVTGFMAALDAVVARQRNQSGWFAQQWAEVVAPVEAAGVPHAVLLGNHDRQADLDGWEILSLDRESSGHCLTQLGPAGLTGQSNYWLDVLGATGDAPMARIWMLDTNEKGCGNASDSWGCVGADTLAWVKAQAAALPEVPTQLAFLHIPPPEVLQLWGRQPTWGLKREPSGCSSATTDGTFQALKEAGIQALHFGHDHSNCFHGTLEGVRLAYGRKTGMGNYGPALGVKHGARVILLRQGESAAVSETWIRTGGGEREDERANREVEKLGGGLEASLGACSKPSRRH